MAAGEGDLDLDTDTSPERPSPGLSARLSRKRESELPSGPAGKRGYNLTASEAKSTVHQLAADPHPDAAASDLPRRGR